MFKTLFSNCLEQRTEQVMSGICSKHDRKKSTFTIIPERIMQYCPRQLPRVLTHVLSSKQYRVSHAQNVRHERN